MTIVNLNNQNWILEFVIMDALNGVFKDEYISQTGRVDIDSLARDYRINSNLVAKALVNIRNDYYEPRYDIAR